MTAILAEPRMHSGSMMYNFLLVPLGIFGTLSVCLAFAFLLPGVGQGLAAIWTFVVADLYYQKWQDARSGADSKKPH